MTEELLPTANTISPSSGVKEMEEWPPSENDEQESVEEDTKELMEWLNDKTASPGPSAPRSSRLHHPSRTPDCDPYSAAYPARCPHLRVGSPRQAVRRIRKRMGAWVGRATGW